MKRALLQAGLIFIFAPLPAQASVIEFFDDGSIVRHDAVDYRKRAMFDVRKSQTEYSHTKKYDVLIASSAKKYGVKQKLIKAVIYAESGFRQDAVSPKGAMGLMQLMPATAKFLGVKDAYDPQQNIEGGTKYLSQLLDTYSGNTHLVLAAYNAGEKAVTKYNGVPPYKETQEYVAKITDMLAGE